VTALKAANIKVLQGAVQRDRQQDVGVVNITKKINFCEGGLVGGIKTPEAKNSSHVQQTRCPIFSYADIAKGRRMLNPLRSKPEN